MIKNQSFMKFTWLKTSVAALVLAGGVSSSSALVFDQDVTPDVIFGSGNDNGAFTIDQSNGVELGLRAKLRHNASGSPENTFNSNGDGTYSFNAGVAPTQSSPTAEWSFEWSINTDYGGSSGWSLDDLAYSLSLDKDPSLGTGFSAFDPINLPYADHAIGDNTTGNGSGQVAADAAAYSGLIAANNVAQNSWKAHWFFGPDFDPTVDATYDIMLGAFDGDTQVAETHIQVIVGEGGSSSVPDAGGTLLLSAVGFLALTGMKRKLSVKGTV